MNSLLKITLKWIFRILVLLLLVWYLVFKVFLKEKEASAETTINSLVTQVETMGKLELVKFHTQEVTEIKKPNQLFGFMKDLLPANKAILISKGEAVGCIDLQKISREDITIQGDTVYVNLPEPELCYFKVDLENSRLYEMETTLMTSEQRGEFVNLLYRQAENQVRIAAESSGILQQVRDNAELILKPILENVSGKTVLFNKQPQGSSLDFF